MRRRRLAALVLGVLTLVVPMLSVSAQIPKRSQQATDDQAVRSSVLVYGGVECDSAPVEGFEDIEAPVLDTCTAGWTGSGTIVDPSGLVMTNAHIALGNDGEPMWTVVGLTEDADELPTLAYFALPTIYDPTVDLAVLTPIFTLDGEFIEEGDLDLPPMLLPDSEGVIAPGDQVRLVGYPGLSDEEAVEIDEVEVASALPDEANPELGDMGWLDVGPFAGPGISGGGVISERGLLVGVATGSRSGEAGGQEEELVRPLPEALGLLVERAEQAGQLGEQPLDDPTPEPVDDPDPVPQPTQPPREDPNPGPPDPVQSESAYVQGTFVSADTGEPISGVLFLVLQPGVTIQQFVDSDFDSQLVFGVGVSDGSGFFQIEPQLARGQAYGFVIIAEGYEPLAGEDLVFVPEDAPATVDIGEIPLAAAQ